MDVRGLSLDQVRRFLKISKSEVQDHGPYCAHLSSGGWYEIIDRYGYVVGQAPAGSFANSKGDQL